MRVSGQFYFLNEKISHPVKAQKHISKQKQKRKSFYALKKKTSKGRKSLIRLFAFLCFLCAFCAFYAFLCVKQKRQHFYAHKNM